MASGLMARWTNQLRVHFAAKRLRGGAGIERIAVSYWIDLARGCFGYSRFHLFDSCSEGQSADDDRCRPRVCSQPIRLVETAKFKVASRGPMEGSTRLNEAATVGEVPNSTRDNDAAAYRCRKPSSPPLAWIVLILFKSLCDDRIPGLAAYADVR